MKRVDIHVPAYLVKEGLGKIQVRLSDRYRDSCFYNRLSILIIGSSAYRALSVVPAYSDLGQDKVYYKV